MFDEEFTYDEGEDAYLEEIEEDEDAHLEEIEEAIRAAIADRENEEDMHDPAYD